MNEEQQKNKLNSNKSRQRNILILLGIFAAFVIFATYSWWGSSLGLQKETDTTKEVNFTSFNEDSVSVFSIKNGEEEKIIAEVKGKWLVNDLEASKSEISVFFKQLSEAETGGIVSKNSENHKKFGVTEEDGYKVTFIDGDGKTVFIVGNSGSKYNTFYAKKEGSNNVYFVEGSLRSIITQSVDAWRDKTIVNISKDDAQKIKINSKTDPLVLTKKESGEWQAENAGKVAELDNGVADKFISSFGPLEGYGFLNKEEQKEFSDTKNKTTIQIFGANEKQIAEINFIEKDSDWWARSKDKEDIFYRVASSEVAGIMLKREEVF